MRNVLLGGEGVLGTALGTLLKSRGEEVINFDLKSGFDLREKEPPAYPKDTYYWFLAWDVGGAKYIMDPKSQTQIVRSNTRLCEKVFGWLVEREAKFHFISTQMAGYANAYGVTKALGEYWARCAGGQVCRLWNIYDAEPVSEKSHVTGDIVSQAIRGSIKIMTSGAERRQFIHVDDCAEALLHQRDSGQPFVDITSGEWIPIRELAQTVAKLTGATLELGEKAGYESLIEPDRLIQGWKPKLSLEQGLKRVIDRMKENNWY